MRPVLCAPQKAQSQRSMASSFDLSLQTDIGSAGTGVNKTALQIRVLREEYPIDPNAATKDDGFQLIDIGKSVESFEILIGLRQPPEPEKKPEKPVSTTRNAR